MPRRGAALPFAITFAVVIFFLITVQVAQVNYNLRLVQGTSEGTRTWCMARSIVNEAIARLNEDPTFTLENPYRTEQHGFTLTAKQEPDPTNPDLLHIRGQAWPTDNPSNVQTFTRVLLKQPPIQGVVYSSGSSSLGIPTSIFRAVAGSKDWSLLPMVPNTYYDTAGNKKTVAGDFGTMVGWLAADQRGNAYSVYYPRMGNGLLSQIAANYTKDTLNAMPRATELMIQHGKNMDQHAGAVQMLLSNGNRVPSILRYSTQEGAWDALPPLPAPGTTNDFLFPGMPVSVAGGMDNVYAGVVHQGKDYIYAYDSEADAWSTLPHPTGQQALRSLTADAKGNVYAQWAPSHSNEGGEFFQYDGAEWTQIPLPPRTYDGVNIPSNAKLGQLTSSPKGELYATFYDHDRPDQLVKYAEGSWTLVELPPPAYYDSSGNLATEAPRTKIDFVGVDAEGSVTVKYPKLKQGDPDTIYRRTKSFEALDPIPDKGYNADGSSRGGTGLAQYQGPIAGGGAPVEGGQKYTPAAEY